MGIIALSGSKRINNGCLSSEVISAKLNTPTNDNSNRAPNPIK